MPADSEDEELHGADDHGGADEGGAHRRAGASERRVLFALNSALRVARLHALDNVVAKDALEAMAGLLGEYLAGHRELVVAAAEGRIYVNGGSLKKRRQGHSWLDDFLEFLERMGIGGMIFRGGWDATAARALLESFAAVGPQPPAERLAIVHRELERRLHPPAQLQLLSPVQSSDLAGSGEDDGEADELSPAAQATLCYARLLALLEDSHADVQEGGSPDERLRELRQVLMALVEQLRDPAFQQRLLGLSALAPGGEDPFAGHAVNVCVLALSMGRLLGLSRGQLADLGFAALFHDLGRAVVGREPSTTQALERQRTALGHVIGGVSAALRGRSYDDGGLLRLIVAQEVHRVTEGYPPAGGLRRPHLYSRIVAVADAFERACQGTPWRPPESPVRALETIAEPGSGGERFEPALLQLLRDVLGPRPRGTLLRLDTGELTVVVDGGARRGGRAVVRRVLLTNGAPDEQGTLAELEPGQATRVLEPQSVDLDWGRFLLA